MDFERFIAHLEWAEGRRNRLYEDSVGKQTIGVGRNVTDNGLSEEEITFILREGISDEAVDLLRDNDIKMALSDARKLPYWDSLNSARQLVVADMVFNLGLGRFKKFVLANNALAVGDWETAANEMVDSKWYRQTGRRARKLVQLMRSGR